MKVAGKIIVLTGASSGIGEQAALQLAAKGAQLCLVARRKEELERVQRAIASVGGTARSYAADLSDEAAIADCAARILADHPRIDVLVNNAARSIRRPIRESLDRLHDYQRTMQLNYFGAVQLTLALLPRLLATGAGQVINSSTLSTQVPIPLFSAYLASKAAMESFARSLAAEEGHRGLVVTTIHFPMVRTAMSGKTRIYQYMPMLAAEKAAAWIVEAVEKRPSRIARPLGTLGELAMAASPGAVNRLSQYGFRLMDQALKKLADRNSV